MDQADEELRATVQIIWPLQAKKMLDLLIPRNDGSSSPTTKFRILIIFFDAKILI
jgi:Voltage gated calcium channel IQ domain